MRTDLGAPRTRLLAVVAGWAVLVLVLALAGMGGRTRPLPLDAVHMPELPQPRAGALSRVGPMAQYMQVAARPVFDPGRRPRPFFIENTTGAESNQGFDFTLSSVLITPALQMVILQPGGGGDPVRVKLGEEPAGSPGWRLAEVAPRSAAFDGPEGRRTLELAVYTGVAPIPGQSPAAAPDATPPAAAANPAGEPDVTTAQERQMQQIRQRIEARRAQMRQREQAQSAAGTPPVPPPQP